MATMNATDIHLQKCPHHDTEKQSFYCDNHDVTICGRCLYSNHKQCNCVDLFNVTVDHSRQSEIMTMLSACEKEIEGYEQALRKDIRLNEQCKSNAIHAVDSFFSTLMERLTNLKKDAERECTKKYKQNSECLSQLVEKCNEEKLMLSQRKRLLEVLVQKQHSRHLYLEICRLDRNKNDISAKINGLMETKQIVKFSFRPNEKLTHALCSEVNEIGKIQETINESDEVAEDVVQNYAFKTNTKQVYARNGRGRNTGNGQRQVDSLQLQESLQIQRQSDANTNMVYTLYGNVIVMLEAYEARTDRVKLPRSAIDLPDQSWKTDEDLMGNVESQLVLFEALIEASPMDIGISIHKELRIQAIYWAAVRAETRLPQTEIDTFIARLYEILVKRSNATETCLKQTSNKMWKLQNEASKFGVSYNQNRNKADAFPKIRTPANKKYVRSGAKRIQDAKPQLRPFLQKDVEEDELAQGGLK